MKLHSFCLLLMSLFKITSNSPYSPSFLDLCFAVMYSLSTPMQRWLVMLGIQSAEEVILQACYLRTWCSSTIPRSILIDKSALFIPLLIGHNNVAKFIYVLLCDPFCVFHASSVLLIISLSQRRFVVLQDIYVGICWYKVLRILYILCQTANISHLGRSTQRTDPFSSQELKRDRC